MRRFVVPYHAPTGVAERFGQATPEVGGRRHDLWERAIPELSGESSGRPSDDHI